MVKKVCILCLKELANKSNLIRHIKKIHSPHAQTPVDEFEAVRQNSEIYSTRSSLDDLRHIQQGGLYGAGTSLEFASDKAGEDVDSQSESDKDDFEFSDKSEGIEPDVVDNFCPLDIWCEIHK